MSEDQSDRDQLARLLDRRAFLGVSGTAAGVLMGMSATSALAKPPHRHHRPQRHHRRLGASSEPYSYPPPLALEADCSLSEDHYLFRIGAIDPNKDEVMAYSRGDGQVEAIVLQAGVLSQFYRDPSATGGWNIRAVRDVADVTDMVAGMASVPGTPSAPQVLHVFYRAKAAPNLLAHVTQQADGSFGVPQALPWNANAGHLQIANDSQAGLLVYTVKPSTGTADAPNPDGELFFYYTGLSSSSSGFSGAGILTGLTVPDLRVLTVPAAACVSVNLSGDPVVEVYTVSAAAFFSDTPVAGPISTWMCNLRHARIVYGLIAGELTPTGLPAVPALPASVGGAARVPTSVAYLGTVVKNAPPLAVVSVKSSTGNGLAGELWILSYQESGNAVQAQWSWSQAKLPDGISEFFTCQATQRIVDDEQLIDVFLVDPITHTLAVVRQVYQTGPVPQYNPAVPLQGNVSGFSTEALASRGDQLIVVETDGNLHELIRHSAPGDDPSTPTIPVNGTWSDYAIHLPPTATEAVEVSAYRVQLSLSDGNGIPVGGRALSVAAATPVPALVDGNAATLSPTPTRVSTDQSGRVTLGLLADGLSAPVLTVSADGVAAQTVSPSARVNAYMTGTTTLNYLPKLDGGVLAGATTTSNQPIFPKANANSADARSAVTVLSAAAQAGANPTNTSGTGGTIGTPTLQASRPVIVGGYSFSLDQLFVDGVHAIKSGVAKVASAVVSFDQTLKQWTADLTADFAAWGRQALNVVIHSLEDAAHVFHSVINYLGAAISAAIDWLKAKILTVLHDAVALAALYQGWLGKLPDQLTALIGQAKQHADKSLDSLQTGVTGALDTFVADHASKTLGQLGQSTQVARPRLGHHPRHHEHHHHDHHHHGHHGRLGDVPDSSTVGSPPNAHSSWVLQKVQQSNVSAAKTPTVSTVLDGLIKDLKDGLETSGGEFAAAAQKAIQDITKLANPKTFATVTVKDLIAPIKLLIDALFALLETILNALLDLLEAAVAAFNEIINLPLGDLPLIGSLLPATQLTVGGLITLLIAFPTALAYKLAHGPDAKLFANVSSQRRRQPDFTGARALSAHPSHRHRSHPRLGDDRQTQQDLNFATGSAVGLWAFLDLLSSIISAAVAPDDGPDLFIWVDTIAPAVIGCLTMPAQNGGLPFTSAINPLNNGGWENGDVQTATSWTADLAPSLFGAIILYTKKTGTKAAADAVAVDQRQLTSCTGIISLLAGVWAAIQRSSSLGTTETIVAAAEAILGSVANIIAPAQDAGAEWAFLGGAVGAVCTGITAALTGLDGYAW